MNPSEKPDNLDAEASKSDPIWSGLGLVFVILIAAAEWLVK